MSPRILLGVTGSVAAVKAPELAVRLVERGYDVRVVITHGGESFWEQSKEYNAVAWEAFAACGLKVYDSTDEWKGWQRLGDPVLHIELRDWADLCLIAPLSAHTLAKLAHGLCDDLLSSVLRAWDWGYHRAKPVVLAPAMNTAMWVHPLTAAQLATVQSFAHDMVTVVPPQVKELACGEVGEGALASVTTIVEAVEKVVNQGATGCGKTVG